jgi:iron complex transport system permease protein
VNPLRWVLIVAGAVVSLAVGVALGSVRISPSALIAALAGEGDPSVRQIVFVLRAPRVALTFAVGGALGLAGASLQAVLRNPLADPYLLGISGGAGLGVVTAIALGLNALWGLPIAAFVGASAALALVYRLGLVGPGMLDSRILLLGGVVVGAFAAAVSQAIVALADAQALRNAMLWLWGGFGGASWLAAGVFTAYAAPAALVLLAAAWPLDLLALGEEPAAYLGADVERVKRRVYLAASLLTAAAVAVAGVIGFVGLVVPHAVRLGVGHVHRRLLPAAFLVGGSVLVLADALARTAVAPRELPVGIVTALIGVPVFMVVLRRWTR